MWSEQHASAWDWRGILWPEFAALNAELMALWCPWEVGPFYLMDLGLSRACWWHEHAERELPDVIRRG